ncbi:MAG: isocitrate lyase/PEP mutase family protein [Rhizobiales bacterium]|nr:isocitrate lyase/PEP mutase family protein [Hyphomicrobiales bacterium]
MTANTARKRFRDVLNGSACVHPGSVFDPVSARIAEDLGFEVGMFAGSIASLTVLGAPDAILLTLTEFADQARRICRASNLALMCDADHGYGNALNVMRTVEELENAGVAGLSIEDTLLPMQFGSPDKVELVSIEEGTGKVKAALDARQDDDLVIVGRTSAAAITDAADAARRLKAYQAAGADALFAVGVRIRADLDVIADATDLPLIVGGIGPDMMDRDYLASRKVRLALQGHQPFAAAVEAIHTALKALRDGTPPSDLKRIASPDLMKQAMRSPSFRDRVRMYLQED